MYLSKHTLIILFSALLLLSACKEKSNYSSEPEQDENTLSAGKQDNNKSTTDAVYKCPMDCEDGKTYSEAGSCPICKMDLALLENGSEQKSKQGMHGQKAKHNKKKMCQCKEGECKCKKGECKCGTPGYDHFGNKI